MTVQIHELKLNNYRNYKDLRLVFNNGIIIILGENGSGKTNILEAISLLSPGSGIRGAKNEDISRNSEFDWSCSLSLQSKLGSASVNYYYSKMDKTRNIEYNGSRIRTTELSQLANIIWLTPQMDGIFLSPAADRRRFLDRIVYNFYPQHASNINKYTHLTSERLKILTSRVQTSDSSWLDVLEQQIAELALKISTMRKDVVFYLHNAIDGLDSPFPKARLSISPLILRHCGPLKMAWQSHEISTYKPPEIATASSKSCNDDLVTDEKFLEIYIATLNKNRQKDGITKRTNFGITKQELIVEHSEKNQLAKFCSTGEQKALLISILLGQIEANITIAKTTPIVLLDEVFVHLDNKRKTYLASYIINSKLQTFITATDSAGIEDITSLAEVVQLQ